MRSLTVLAIALLLTMGTAQMRANTIALEGSDATAFHHEGTYTTQLFTFLQAGSAKKVLVLGGVPLSGAVGQYDLNPDYSLATALVTFGTTIVDYSAVYVVSVGGCCTQADYT